MQVGNPFYREGIRVSCVQFFFGGGSSCDNFLLFRFYRGRIWHDDDAHLYYVIFDNFLHFIEHELWSSMNNSTHVPATAFLEAHGERV